MNRFLQTGLLLLVGLCMLTEVAAQSMKVVSFRKLENDMTPKLQGTARFDNNGRTSALIRVVAPGKGYAFDGGTTGIVGNVEYHAGEYWVYVPEKSRKLSISHEKYGVLRDYNYDEAITAGTAYELLLDPGVGRFVSITTSRASMPVFIDGDSVGLSPLPNTYLLYGRHDIKAESGRLLGEKTIVVSDSSSLQVRVDVEDMSKYYVNLTMKVEGDAEIWFNDRKVGVGSWSTELYKGDYVVQTRKANCESRSTSIKVVPGMQSTVTLTPPVPYLGFLNVKAFPHDVAITSGKRSFSNGVQVQVPAGSMVLSFAKKGYHPAEREYTIRRNELTADTVRLERISYVRSKQFYFGAGFTYHTLSGITGLAGATYHNIDLQLSYTLGLSSSDPIRWYANGNNYQSTCQYKQSLLAVKVGYQFEAISRTALIPQLGYSLLTLSGSRLDGQSTVGDGAKCDCLSLGAKIVFVPTEHVGVFLCPEYQVSIQKDAAYQAVAQELNLTEGGFFATAGIIVKF